MRPDPDRTRGWIQARGSLLTRLLLVNLTAVAGATLLAGIGVSVMADIVIVRGDMMVAEHYQEFQRQTGWYLLTMSAFTFLVAGGATWYLTRQIIRPIDRIKQVAEAVAGGDYRLRLHEPIGGELGNLAAAIDRMTESLERVEQLRRDLMANVAHELRTPLTSAHGLICAVRDRLVPANEDTLDQVGEDLARLIRLVEAIHQLSLSDAATIRELPRTRLDLAALVREVSAGMAPLYEVKRQELAVDPGPRPLWVQGNRDALVQVLVNLLDNAAKYATEGARIEVMCTTRDRMACVSVVNGGPGIDPVDLPHIFERFYRTEKSRSRDLGGAGIGLAIVKNLVESHRGRITADSGGGRTTFTVLIPLV